MTRPFDVHWIVLVAVATRDATLQSPSAFRVLIAWCGMAQTAHTRIPGNGRVAIQGAPGHANPKPHLNRSHFIWTARISRRALGRKALGDKETEGYDAQDCKELPLIPRTPEACLSATSADNMIHLLHSGGRPFPLGRPFTSREAHRLGSTVHRCWSGRQDRGVAGRLVGRDPLRAPPEAEHGHRADV